jgi:NADH dehydrogenase FAD-containing subunit
VKVNADLSIAGHPEIFVIGDLAYPEQDGVPLPGIAPVAMQEGRYVASVIVARLEGRTPKTLPILRQRLSGGHRAEQGRGVIGGVKLHGWIAWFVWLFVHLMYFGRRAQSSAGVPALGLPVCDVLSGRAPHYWTTRVEWLFAALFCKDVWMPRFAGGWGRARSRAR